MRPNNVPEHAIEYTFYYGRNKECKFYIWISLDKFQWYALGYGGEENTRKAAENMARQWITDGRILSKPKENM